MLLTHAGFKSIVNISGRSNLNFCFFTGEPDINPSVGRFRRIFQHARKRSNFLIEEVVGMKRSKWVGLFASLAIMIIFAQNVQAGGCVLQVTLKNSYPSIAVVGEASIMVQNLEGFKGPITINKGTTSIPLTGSCAKGIQGTLYSQLHTPYEIIPSKVANFDTLCLPCQIEIEQISTGAFVFQQKK